MAGEPSFIAIGTATTPASPGSVSSIAVTIPATAQTGDFLLAVGEMRSAAVSWSTTPPTGWTLLRNVDTGQDGLITFWKFATSGDPGSSVTLTVASAGVEFPSAAVLAYRGTDPTNPVWISVGGGDNTFPATWPASGINNGTAPAPYTSVICWGGWRSNAPLTSFPASVTSRCDISGASRELAIADEAVGTGVQPDRTATPNASENFAYTTIAVIAPPTPKPPRLVVAQKAALIRASSW